MLARDGPANAVSAARGEGLAGCPQGWLERLLGRSASLPFVGTKGWRGMASAPPSIPPEMHAPMRARSRAAGSPPPAL